MRRSTCNRLPARPSFLFARPAIPAFIATALVRPRASLEGNAAVTQLAEDFRHAGHREGGITSSELELLGWTADQLDRFIVPARIRAQSLAGMGL